MAYSAYRIGHTMRKAAEGGCHGAFPHLSYQGVFFTMVLSTIGTAGNAHKIEAGSIPCHMSSPPLPMVNDYLLRIGDGKHFLSSSLKNIWGINSKQKDSKGFMGSVKEGDRLWFVKGQSRGLIIAVATFTSTKDRVLGPLLPLTYTNDELGWVHTEGDWDTEVHYKDLYYLIGCELYSEIKSPLVIRLYSEKCKVNLPVEYPYIVRYANASKTLA